MKQQKVVRVTFFHTTRIKIRKKSKMKLKCTRTNTIYESSEQSQENFSNNKSEDLSERLFFFHLQ